MDTIRDQQGYQLYYVMKFMDKDIIYYNIIWILTIIAFISLNFLPRVSPMKRQKLELPFVARKSTLVLPNDDEGSVYSLSS